MANIWCYNYSGWHILEENIDISSIYPDIGEYTNHKTTESFKLEEENTDKLAPYRDGRIFFEITTNDNTKKSIGFYEPRQGYQYQKPGLGS